MNYRNLLFVPGHNEQYFNSIHKYNPDAIILDLEDSVPIDYKEKAVKLINEKMEKQYFKNFNVYIRINHESINSMIHELSKLNLKNLAGIMLPKVEHKEDVIILDSFLNDYEREYNLPIEAISIILLIESPLGLINLSRVVDATPRIKALAFGSEDYCTLMKAERTIDTMDYPRKIINTYARAYNLKCYDAVFPYLTQPEILKDEAKTARVMGFDGKLIVHPAQIQIINDEFKFSEIELAQMRQTIEDFEAMQGEGVLVVKGKIVEKPHIARYKEIIKNNNN